MKLTESLFSFPSILYDEIQMIKRETNEIEKEYVEHEGEMPYVVGIVKIPFEEINSYSEYWTKGLLIEEVIEKGCNCTMITTNSLGTFLCIWDIKKLESKLNIHEDKILKDLELQFKNL
jgi:hypothetical protein